jgi:pimeloyl-ACP methyl ester carboxylesterase
MTLAARTRTIEVIEKGSSSDIHPTPLLFVHGGWHAAWCWDEGFLDFFADAGYRAIALSVRGHGSSPTAKPLSSCSVADYVEDVCSVADDLPTAPVLIGHSMGGFLVQTYLANRNAPAAVLLASMPPQTRRRVGVAFRAMRRHPLVALRANTVGSTADLVNTPRLARDHFFSTNTPECVVESCAARLGEESWGAPGFSVRLKPARVATPLLILGAEKDNCVSNGDVRATARAYRSRPEFFPGGHNMMLEPGWPVVARRIHCWLNSQGI